ncbi:SEC-C metal-binding domain-containing protein [Virgibacillus byunsanensis]|uniref:SEC-C metal-binding domain-containing protein n=1 Tax=Virgibacillus byunsanensis TaxID=570945 RepID=A0ABW3LNP1_9BACI
MQTTFIERVHPFLNYEEAVVQDFALGLLEESYLANEKTLPIVLEANKNRNLQFVDKIKFPMSENCFLELLHQIKTLNKTSRDYKTALTLVMNSPIPFLQQYKEHIIPCFNNKQRNLFHDLLNLASLSTSELFDELKNYADQIGTRYDNKSFQVAGKIIELLSSRNDWDRKMVVRVLEQEEQEDFVSIYGIFFVMLAGETRMQQMTPTLVKLLFNDLDQDVLVEEVIQSLVKIGGDEVVDSLMPYVNDEETGPFALDVVKQIKSPYAEEMLLQLVEEVAVEPVRTLIADALCMQLSTKAIPIIEKIIDGEYAGWYVDLPESLYCNCMINEIDHPKLQEWKNEITEMGWNDGDFELFQGIGEVTEPIRNEQKVGRNEPCPCGSGKKFKKCCGK